MKSSIIIVLFVLSAASAAFAQSASLTADDLKVLEGDKWIGTLTYLDYRSNKKTSIKSNLIVRRAENGGLWWFDYEYPDEPKANGSTSTLLMNDGRKFLDQDVIERTVLPDKALRVITTRMGEDNNKKALFRYTYTFGSKAFSVKKEVQLEGTPEWFERNEYSWKR